MGKNTWQPNRALLDEGWRFFSLVEKENLTPQYKEHQLERFLDVVVIESEYGRDEGYNNYEMYVKAYPEIPADQNPGGGFIQVGCLESEEEFNEGYENHLKACFKHRTGRDVKSTLVLPGPFFIPSRAVKGQFEKVTAYDKIVWMR